MLSQVFRADHRMRTAMDYQYETVDVFTATRFGGNPLAVILDARGQSDRVQRLRDDRCAAAGAPGEHGPHPYLHPDRLPFAGHPNVGTAFVLARHSQVVVRGACVPMMAGALTL